LLEKLAECTSWHDDVQATCQAQRKQPISPHSFEQKLDAMSFTYEADKQVVASLYREVFAEVFMQVRAA
jgi:hypothetical protein